MGLRLQRRPRLAAALACSIVTLSCADPPKTPKVDVARASAASASASPPAPASSLSAPPASSSAAPIASASAPPRRPLPLPKPPPGVDAAQFEVLASICAVASWTLDGGSSIQVGCRSMPPFDRPEELPDGSIQAQGNFSNVCFLEAFHRGSFSAAGKDEALLGLAACGEDRWNDITPGNIVLAEHDADGWHVRAVQPNTNLRGCVPAKGYSPTLLVCDDNIGAFSDGSIWWRFTLDFTLPAGKRASVFSKLYKTPGVTCNMGADFFIEREVTVWSKLSERLADVDGDGLDDLSFTIERAYTPGTPALGRKYDAACKKKKPDGDMSLDLSRFVGPSKRFTLEFKGNGRSLVPTPKTAKLLEEWGALAPEFWWNVVK